MAAKRKSLTKKVRFEVFHRDSFICAYCGVAPPATVLEVDHITPVSKGGTNDINNLITSCFDCNRGKGAKELCSAPESVTAQTAKKRELEAQLKAYRELIHEIAKREDDNVDEIEAAIRWEFDRVFTASFRNTVKKQFLSRLLVDDLIGYMEQACCRCDNATDAIKYFCGICWNVIKGRGYH